MRRPIAFGAFLYLSATLLLATDASGQRGGITPEWVDATPKDKLVGKTWETAAGTVRLRGGLMVVPGFKALFMQQSSKPENMDVQLYLEVSNRTPATLCAEMSIEIPGQKKESSKLAEIKVGYLYRHVAKIKEIQWGIQYPVRVTLFTDKKKSKEIASTTAFLVFDEAYRSRLDEAKAFATEQWHADRLTYVTLSGWPEPAPVQTAHANDQNEQMVEGTVADAELQTDIQRTIGLLEEVDHPGCEMVVVKKMRSASDLGMERWTVKSCDFASTYEMRMVASPKGGTDFSTRRMPDTTAQGFAAAPATARKIIEGKPPFEWDAKNSSSELSLTYEEKKRSKIQGMRGTVIEYDLRAAGFSTEEDLTLWMKWLDGKHMGFPVVRTTEGLLRMMDEGKPLPTSLMSSGFTPGQPLAMALHSSTSGKRAFTEVVFFPIAARGAGGCSVGVELRAPSALLFQITFRGFAPEEEVQIVSQYKKEKIPHAVKTSASGEGSLPVLFGPDDKGKATISVTGKACSATLEYKIGKDAFEVQ